MEVDKKFNLKMLTIIIIPIEKRRRKVVFVIMSTAFTWWTQWKYKIN